eukprot:scaffold428_cov168-Ochromonas_danica.AAC.41
MDAVEDRKRDQTARESGVVEVVIAWRESRKFQILSDCREVWILPTPSIKIHPGIDRILSIPPVGREEEFLRILS